MSYEDQLCLLELVTSQQFWSTSQINDYYDKQLGASFALFDMLGQSVEVSCCSFVACCFELEGHGRSPGPRVIHTNWLQRVLPG